MHQAPFTAYFTITPKGGTRLERLRHAQKASVVFYRELQEIVNVQTAQPGGSQNALWRFHDFTDVMDGVQVKPQFGDSPAQLVIAGFFEVNAPLVQNYANGYVFHAGRSLIGPVDAHIGAVMSGPSRIVAAELSALKSELDAAVDVMNDFYPTLGMRTFRVVYKGMTFGDRGYYFPPAPIPIP